MWGLKRGLTYIVISLLAIILSASTVFAGYCLDPLSVFYCLESTEDECCGGPCGTGLYDISTTPPAVCVLGCCFATSGSIQVCLEGATYQGLCDYELGIFGSTCSVIQECDYGCCCWFVNVNQSDINFRGECEPLPQSDFTIGLTDPEACSELCDTNSSGQGNQTQNPECSDGVNNDPTEDMLIDAVDPGCLDNDGNYNPADNSETDGAPECTDNWDNDADSYTDDADSCCVQFPNRREDFCDLPVCTTTGQISTLVDECRCRDSYRCSGGEYCCVDGCSSQPCGGATCITGSRRSCGIFDANDCELFRYCIDSEWGDDCTPDPMCGQPPEVCVDGIDNNGDGNIDCLDIFCHELECDPAESTCLLRGYWDTVNSIWKCCFTGDVNDCFDDDGIPETCGTCNCLTSPDPPEPFLIGITQGFGEPAVIINWGLDCDVDNYVYRCIKGDTNCDNLLDFSLISPATRDREFIDNSIEENLEYCYFIQADYPLFVRNSDIQCITSGNGACFGQLTSNFCLNETYGIGGKRPIRAHCTDENSLEIVENCEASYGLGHVCMGPYPSGETRCIYQSACDSCGEPINMYADFVTSRAVYRQPGSPTEYEEFCRNIPTCYFDYSDTTVDSFHECTEIDNCYRYRSSSACEEQVSTFSNNKCLPRDCQWSPIAGDLDLGICFETAPQFRACEYCNYAENNGIFDKCTVDRCVQFGDCYPRQIDGMCVDTSHITCQDYTTEDACTGGKPVDVNVAYSFGARIPGNYDNVVDPSNDEVGIGLCKWDGNTCMKDADGDDLFDPYPFDKTPPYSRLITLSKVLTLNFTLQVSDLNPDNSQGTGVLSTYICKNNSAYCYPTEKYFPTNSIVSAEFGGGHGMHTFYYYSEDRAHNLEVVKQAIIEVDRSPPEITIEAYIVNDIINFVDSSVTFVVSVNEDATCVDDFEGVAPKIPYLFGNRWMAEYTGLTDGTYTYKVNCTDTMGNTAVKYYDLRIIADSAIFDPKPSGQLDYTPVGLGVSTALNVPCRFGPVEDLYDRLPNAFQPAVDMGDYYYHFFSWDLDQSGTYSFDVKCDLGDRISDDEIQFVYDITPPETLVLDMYGEAFDFSKLYNGIEDKVFLGCSDSPENGFGCNKTYYCVDSDMCTPDTLNDAKYPIEYELPPGGETWICYYSVENTINSLGGLIESTVCRQIKVDHYSPTLTIQSIQHHDTQDNPYVTVDNSYVLRGTVFDQDSAGGLDNKVTIIVSSADNPDNETMYEDISSNPDFIQRIALWEGMNIITVIAADRSGATDSKTIYILVAQFGGDKIVLVQPNKFGVSGTRIFDLVVQTYRGADCRFSINDASFANSEPMVLSQEPAGDGYNYYHTKSGFQLGSTSEVEEPVFIKCRDTNSYPFEQVFNLSWDDSKPLITDIYLNNSDGREPATIVEFPLESNIIVETDDKSRCKLSTTIQNYGCCMDKFDGFDNQDLMNTNQHLLAGLLDQTSYTYFIQCENGAGLVSERMMYRFSVDTTLATDFTFLSPPRRTSNTSLVLRIQTTKNTNNCMFGTSSNPSTPMVPVDEKTHEASITVSEGTHTYYFECLTFDTRISDSYTFIVDTSPPSVPVIEVDEISWYLVKLSAKWKSNDSLTKVTFYNYSIGTSSGAADILSWTATSDDRVTANGLNLTNGGVYYWSVKAMNEVGLWSNVGHSDGTLIDTSHAGNWTNGTDPPVLIEPGYGACYNGIKDDNETGIDCGGVCPPCGAGVACMYATDCLSRNCVDGVCVEATCDDGILNQDESDIDCGGICSPCELGSNCVYDSDCTSKYCSIDGICSESSCFDNIKNGDEQGIDCGGSCPEECKSGTCTTEDGSADSDCDRMPDYWERKYDLDVYADDADEDPDEDGYSNYEEYLNGTDPTVPDGGGRSLWMWILLIFVMLIIVAGGSYVGYTEYEKRKIPMKRAIPGASPVSRGRVSVAGHPQQPPKRKEKTPQEKYIDSLAAMIRKKRNSLKQKDRGKILSGFDEKKPGPTKPKTLQKLKPVQKSPAKQTSLPKKAPIEQKPVVVPKINPPKPPMKPPKPPTRLGPKQPPKLSSRPKRTAPKQKKTQKALDDLTSIAGKNKTDSLAELSKIAKGKKKSKKAQVESQLFIYILSILIIGLLLYFGITWIGQLVNTADKIEATKFKVDLESAFEGIRTEYGDQKTHNLRAPAGLERICFVDSGTKPQPPQNYGLCNPLSEDYDALMCNAWNDNVSSILFSPPVETEINIGPVEIPDSKYVCMNVLNNKDFTIILVGLGDRVKLIK